MADLTRAQPTLVAALDPAGNIWLRNVALAFAGSMLLYISAKFKIPFVPVPFTLQTFAVLALGMALGWRLGAATVLLYLAEGAVGLPVFTSTPEKGIGIAYMLGPTGGYLVGFVLAAAVIGWLAERGWDRNVFTAAAAMLIGNIVIYVPGVLWLAQVINSFDKAVQFGLTPFIWSDLLKLALAAALMPLCWRYLQRRG